VTNGVQPLAPSLQLLHSAFLRAHAELDRHSRQMRLRGRPAVGHVCTERRCPPPWRGPSLPAVQLGPAMQSSSYRSYLGCTAHETILLERRSWRYRPIASSAIGVVRVVLAVVHPPSAKSTRSCALAPRYRLRQSLIVRLDAQPLARTTDQCTNIARVDPEYRQGGWRMVLQAIQVFVSA
jgi:hypothetical protein